MPQTEYALAYFKRYAKFYLQNHTTCWRVEAVDEFSTPGILEINAVEYYSNETTDDITNGIVDGLIEPIEVPKSNNISGETFIKVKKMYDYTFNGTAAADWFVDKKYPVKLIFDNNDPRKVTVQWDSTFSGQFDLCYGNYKKTIVVESLF